MVLPSNSWPEIDDGQKPELLLGTLAPELIVIIKINKHSKIRRLRISKAVLGGGIGLDWSGGARRNEIPTGR